MLSYGHGWLLVISEELAHERLNIAPCIEGLMLEDCFTSDDHPELLNGHTRQAAQYQAA